MPEKNLNFTDALKIASALGIVALAIALLLVISDIIIIFIAAVFFAIALDKPIDRLVRKKVPRAAAAVFIYLAFLALLGLSLYIFLPPFAQEARIFAVNFPVFMENLFMLDRVVPLPDSPPLELSQYLRTLADAIGASAQTIMGTIFKIFGGFISFFVIFFVALFFNIQENGVRRFIFILVPRKHLAYANEFFDQTQKRVSSWLWGKSLSSFFVALAIYLGLIILGIPYALVLAVAAFVFNFIPYVGPMIASLPAILLGFTISIPLSVAAAALYFVVNGIIESFILMPLLMKRAVKMNPALLILLALIGGRLAGILGIIISVPFAAVISLIIEEFLAQHHPIFQEKDKLAEGRR